MTEAAIHHAQTYERHLLRPGQRDIISPLMVKRRMKPKIELLTKSRLKNHPPLNDPSNGEQEQHQQPVHQLYPHHHHNLPHHASARFEFSGIIDSHSMPRISSVLSQNSQVNSKTIGLPTALSVNSKFIAIGTQQGVILVFDLFEELRQQLGSKRSDSSSGASGINAGAHYSNGHASVSAIDLASNGENLVAGYVDGSVKLWDVIKGTMVKAAHDLHSSPITSLRFISESKLSAISVDAGGLVNKVTFSKTMLWNTVSVDTECLLDGTAGQILSTHVLSPITSLQAEKRPKYHPSIKNIVLTALSSERSSFAIAVEPSISVLHRWAKPSPENLNFGPFLGSESPSSLQAFLPCLAWGWALISGGENSLTPILARGWGCYLQLLRANFPPVEDNAEQREEEGMVHWPAFGLHEEFDAAAPILALEWLGDRSLIYLSLTNEFTVVDTVMMTLTERLDFSGFKLVYAEFALSRTAAVDNGGNDDSDVNVDVTSMSTTFQNSVRASDNRLLILCQEEIKSLSILGIQQRVTTLEEDGEWLEALALSLDHYESTIKAQEDRKRDPERRLEIKNHPEFLSRMLLSEDEEWIAELLLRYLTLAVENAPPSSHHQTKKSSRIDLAQSHFQMLAGVCIEYCVVTRRLDLLFNEIYDCFRAVNHTAVFLDVLEPYVLNEKLRYIAPEAMAQFVEHCKITNDVSTVERCLLHMDVTIMDFDSILSLLRKNRMFSALIHVYSHGLDDFVTPLEHLFEAIFITANEPTQRRFDGFLQSDFEKLGYKAILYIRHCFSNKSFPKGDELRPTNRVDTLRPELLSFLIQKRCTAAHKKRGERAIDNGTGYELSLSDYPFIRTLLTVDAKAFMDTLSVIFDDPSVRFVETNDHQDTMEAWHAQISVPNKSANEEHSEETNSENLCPDRMDVIRIISVVVGSMENKTSKLQTPEIFQASKGAFYDFTSKLLLKGIARTPPPLTLSILSRMSTRLAEGEIIKLLQVIPRHSFHREEVLKGIEQEKMPRAALILHQGGVSELLEGVEKYDGAKCARHFTRVIECYLEGDDVKFQKEVFNYVKKECIGGSTVVLTSGISNEKTVHNVLRNALCAKLCQLVNLDPILSAQLVAELYIDDLETILKSLDGEEAGIVQLKFYHAVISGDLSKVDAVAASVLLAHLTIDHRQKYLELMAKFHPELVYQHLISNDNYRIEACLKLCQEYEIADASAYLLERMGNVSSALQLMLQTLEGRMMTLKRVIRGLGTGHSKPKYHISRHFLDSPDHKNAEPIASQDVETDAVRQILTVTLDLCERNSGSSFKTEHGSQLWFNVLDRLINAKGFLRLSKELPEHAAIMMTVLSDLLKMTMQRMVSKVSLTDLLRKITTDHAGNRLGEFREMLTTMLKTYCSELNVCHSAVKAMNKDVRQMSVTKYSRKVRGTMISSGGGVGGGGAFETALIPQGVAGSNKKALLQLHTTGVATIVSPKKGSFYGEGENENSDVQESILERLRQKRPQLPVSKDKDGKKYNPSRIDMSTRNDVLYTMGHSSDAAFIVRQVGVLTEAQHYGRLM
jgi:hypothetical protein